MVSNIFVSVYLVNYSSISYAQFSHQITQGLIMVMIKIYVSGAPLNCTLAWSIHIEREAKTWRHISYIFKFIL